MTLQAQQIQALSSEDLQNQRVCTLLFQIPGFVLVCVGFLPLLSKCFLQSSAFLFRFFFFFFILCPSVFPRVQFNYPQFYFQAGCIVFWGLASSHIHLFIGSFCLQMNSKLQLRVKRKLTKPEMRVN